MFVPAFRFTSAALGLLLTALIAAPRTVSAATGKKGEPAAAKSAVAARKGDRDLSKVTATLRITQGGKPLGEVVLKFFPDVAPNHVKNFIELSESGFYDGTHFHRVIPGFMIQGGDPLSKNPDRSVHGTGNFKGPDNQIRYVKAEFSDRPHKRGTLSAARRGDSIDTASCQFFVCVADTPFLDKQYSVFGEVVSGMDVVDKIVATPRDPRDNPLTDVIIEKIEIKG